MNNYMIIYIILNIITFILYGLDKWFAIKKYSRISEKTLILFSIIGILGAIFGMNIFHHKTKKTKFKIAIPLILILNIIIIIKALHNM